MYIYIIKGLGVFGELMDTRMRYAILDIRDGYSMQAWFLWNDVRSIRSLFQDLGNTNIIVPLVTIKDLLRLYLYM